MPLTMKIQPIDTATIPECTEAVKTIPKSRFKRLFDFSSFLRSNSAAVVATTTEFEPSSVCLDKLVESFLEDSSEKQSGVVVAPGSMNRCGRNNCCSSDGGSDDDFDSFNCFGNSNNNHNHVIDACDSLKSLVACEVVWERNLLADVAKIVDKNKICKRKDEISRKIVVDGLLANGYSVSICKSKWEKTSTYPAGEYEYIDAVIEGERLIVDIDFRAEFEIARSTKSYKAVLQMLPQIFVGKSDRLQKIINIVSDAAKQSLKKKGMPLPPWRRADYVTAKWLSPCSKMVNNCTDSKNPSFSEMTVKSNPVSDPKDVVLCDEFEIVGAAEEEQVVKQWEPVEIKPKAPKTGGKVVSGLASVIEGDC